MRALAVAGALALLLGGCGAPDAPLRAVQVWARPAPAGANGAVYLQLENRGAQDDRLLAAATDLAAQVELHRTHVHASGAASMSAQPAIDLPAGRTVELAPGGLHIMLIDLQRALEQGTTFTLTLRFEHADPLVVEVEVEQR